MANAFIKADKVVATSLGILEREITLPSLVWRDAGGDFRGVLNDTISIRLPAYLTSRTRALRATSAITLDELDETKVDVTLNTNVYKAVKITDEELTLDIVDFSTQVMSPVVHAIARGVEESLSATMTGATYTQHVPVSAADPYLAIVDARVKLNNANVPAGDRFLAVGTGIEAALLKSDRLALVQNSGSDTALREAIVGRIAGFTVVSHPALDPNIGIAAHRSAFVLSMKAPVVPDGVTWGESQSFAGMSMRVIRDYDPTVLADRLIGNVYVGSNTVKDRGTITNGKFTPSVTGSDSPLFVRAVALEMSGSVLSS